MGANTVLGLTLVAAFATIGCGVASIVRRLWGIGYIASFPLGLCAQLGAPVFNKLVAGHLYYLVALAALVVTLRFLSGGSEKRPNIAFLAASLAAGFSIIQIQLYVVAIVLLTLSAIFLRKDAHPVVRMFGVFIASAQIAPQLYAAVGDAPRAYLMLAPQVSWEFNNSAPFPSALYLLGYSPHYAETALGIARSSALVIFNLQLGIVLGLTAFVVNRRSGIAIGVCLSWVILTLLVWGFYGPLSMPLNFAFSHGAAFGVFRELYHFAGPAWVFELILIGSLVPYRKMRIAVVLYSCMLAISLGTMWANSLFDGLLSSVHAPGAFVAAMKREAKRPGNGRFLLWPAEWPVGIRGSDAMGNDPAAYPLGDHVAANEFRLSGPLEVAAGLIRRGRLQEARRWLAAGGIDSLIAEPWLTSNLLDRAPPIPHAAEWLVSLIRANQSPVRHLPSLSKTCMLCAYSNLPVVADAMNWKGGDAYLDASSFEGTRNVCELSLPFDRKGFIAGGWGRLSDWAWLDPRLAAFGDGIITWGGSRIHIPDCNRARRYVRVLLLSGHLFVDGHRAALKPGRQGWIALPAGEGSLSVARGVLAVGNGVVAAPPRAPALTPNVVEHMLRFDWRHGIGSGTVPAGTRWLVLKTAYSTNWRLSVSGGAVLAHLVASGYANAWRLRLHGSATVRVWYARWAATEAIASAALYLWILTLVVCFLQVPIEAAFAVARGSDLM